MNNKEIQNLIKFVAKSGVAEVKLKTGEFAISIKNIPDTSYSSGTAQVFQQPVAMAPQGQEQQPQVNVTQNKDAKEVSSTPENASDSNYITIKSPMIGTFYRKPSPDKPLFVNVGDSIQKGDVVCIIEAMKLFNEIESEVSGKIVKVLVDDATPVEYDQPLFLVDPS